MRRVDLAAFSEFPPSYRSACIAAVGVPDDSRVGPRLEELRALGAPRVITLGPRRGTIWALRATDGPQKLDDRPTRDIPKLIRTAAADWSPQVMSRLAGLVPLEPYQLDFADLGLVPMIERQVNEKLDRLIREVLTGSVERDSSLARYPRRYRHLVRMIFQLLAAKVLLDREHPSITKPLEGSRDALSAAQEHYGLEVTAGEPSAVQDAVCDWAWERIRNGFHFQNLSVDSLAFVYENCLVSREVRRKLGIHGTPRAIAELVVDLLPLEELPEERNVIFEPCSGFAPFLLASMRRLRCNVLAGLDPGERHIRLKRYLRGAELDAFGVEVGRLCLTLADYPNADGWELFQEDVFVPGALERLSQQVGAVLANPPFEAFTPDEQQLYGAVRKERPAELLRRILEICEPELLGFIVPRMVLDSMRSGYSDLRALLVRTFREIDLVDLPDRVFEYSDAETALIVARNRREGSSTTLRRARIKPTEVDAALGGRWLPGWSSSVITANDGLELPRVSELDEIWKRLAHLRCLGEVAEVHRGIEYSCPLDQVPGGVTSPEPHLGYSLGVRFAKDIRPYRVVQTSYLNTEPGNIRVGARHSWQAPKVIVNAARRSRGRWPLVAAPDTRGLWCYQRLFGVWPQSPGEWPLALLVSVLNGPVANAYVAEKSGKRDIHRRTLERIPLPSLVLLDISRIIDLAGQAARRPDLDTILRIDAEVLRGYDLPPRLERRLLCLYAGEDRPGISEFSGYYPADFESALPLHRVLTGLREESTAVQLLATVPVLDDPSIGEMFDQLEAGLDE